MNYELLKKLKDAGFPQREPDMYTFEGEWIPEEEREYIPTLSELIEACMNLSPNHFTMGGMNTWWALMRDKKNTVAIVPVQVGATPEEVVAKLWLELNKK